MSDLKLNRFRKQAQSAILEEYSHCEVPAGCGGAILRWVRPGSPCTLDLRVVASPDAVVRLDGRVPESERVTVEPGEHALTIEMPEASSGFALVWMRLLHRQVQDIDWFSAPNHRWRCALGPPEPAWLEAVCDVSSWPAPVAFDVSPLTDRALESRRKWIVEKGGVALSAPPGSRGPLLLRGTLTADDRGLR